MIQFNLLPDVKLDYIKAERTKRVVIGVALLTALVVLAIFLILLFTVDVVQHKNIKDLSKDIGTYGKQLKSTKDLSKILTVQSQLDSLTQLHSDKVAASRAFAYMNQLTPTSASISKFDVDFTASTMAISGNADSLDTVNKFVDALKYTKFTASDSPKTSASAFSAVVLSSFGRDSKSANYSIALSFDPTIFDNKQTVTLTVDSAAATAQTTSAVLFKGSR